MNSVVLRSKVLGPTALGLRSAAAYAGTHGPGQRLSAVPFRAVDHPYLYWFNTSRLTRPLILSSSAA